MRIKLKKLFAGKDKVIHPPKKVQKTLKQYIISLKKNIQQ